MIKDISIHIKWPLNPPKTSGNGGKLEIAQQMANHESARTTGLYDRRSDQISLDEVERIRI